MEFDLAFRPSTYFREEEPICRLLAACKDSQRFDVYETLCRSIREEDDAAIASLLDRHGLSANLRETLQAVVYRCDPWELPGSTVIASVLYYSTLGDCIWVSAFPTPSGIGYQLGDDIGLEWKWEPKESSEPLTMGELVSLIDSADAGSVFGPGLVLSNLHQFALHTEDDIKQAESFTEVSSTFYPTLAEYYRNRVREEIQRRVELGELNASV